MEEAKLGDQAEARTSVVLLRGNRAIKGISPKTKKGEKNTFLLCLSLIQVPSTGQDKIEIQTLLSVPHQVPPGLYTE
jgi:hypothetical protein